MKGRYVHGSGRESMRSGIYVDKYTPIVLVLLPALARRRTPSGDPVCWHSFSPPSLLPHFYLKARVQAERECHLLFFGCPGPLLQQALPYLGSSPPI
jgi:hypothetical protein